MKYLMYGYIISVFLSIYGKSILQKSIGMFIQGFLHVKIPLSYTHILELVDEKSKKFCTTFINSADALTLAIVGILLKFVNRDLTFLI